MWLEIKGGGSIGGIIGVRWCQARCRFLNSLIPRGRRGRRGGVRIRVLRYRAGRGWKRGRAWRLELWLGIKQISIRNTSRLWLGLVLNISCYNNCRISKTSLVGGVR